MIELARKKKSSSNVPMQTLTARIKVLNLSDQDALLLGLLGFFATKLWNVANHHRCIVWDETGKIPGFAEQCRELKGNRWYKLLPSQSAQEVLGEQDDSYRSWYSHRKNGDKKARPPGFRKKDMLSTVTFKQKAFEILPDNRAKLKLPKTYGRWEIILEYQLPPDTALGKVQQVKLVYKHKTGDWYLHITHKVPIKYRETGNIMSLDLGIVNIVAGLITDGFSFTVPGGELLAIDRYFQKEKAKCTKSTSKKCVELNVKWGRQHNHYLHVLTKWLVNLAITHNVFTIAVGELKGIRTDKNWGDVGNQKLHAWPFSKIISLLTYKAALAGIRVVKVSEKNTSTTCPVCSKRVKKARVHRGLFIHCKQAFNADLVGAYNILRRYLRETGLGSCLDWSGVVGALARPAVNLFVWRKTTPLGRGQGTFKQAS
ncbi:RNA-guided endonuclease InsQ/TnpB family protein [Desulforamulus putei]|uniref:Transposase, IS605 OrfB family, central region n=1 Tax=Desulforamulus putei DSM 12395 TaxID=1121429 RepID=A0A1M5B5N9_9FIRM|nr:RNA-guided endonuclease TnpB family protein [Desulforamulus putei]SHF37726.1 transposase, IS605 OrfB family, central region [Desulforamulus putei DSM 12395]